MEYFDVPIRLMYQTKFIEEVVVKRRASLFPRMIEVSPTSRCNLGCIWCSEEKMRTRASVDMDIDVLQARITEYAMFGTGAVTIEGGGEPTLYPNLPDLIFHIRRLGLDTGLITNGVELLDKTELHKLSWLRVSLDAPDRGTFYEHKGEHLFDKVMSNIECYGRNKRQTTAFGVSYIVTKNTLPGLDGLIRHLREIKGIDYIQLKPVTDVPSPLEVSKRTVGNLQDLETDTFKVHIQSCDKGNAGVPCLAHTLTSIVASNGDVMFCKRLYMNDDIGIEPLVIGNLYKSPVKDIYQGEKMAQWSERVSSGEFCAMQCPTCRLTKYNVFIDKLIKERPTSLYFI